MSSGFARFGRYLREVDISSAFRARTLGPRVFGCLAVAGITAVMGAGIALADDAINGVFAMDGADLSQVTVNTTCGPDGCSGTAQSNVGWIAPIALDHGVWRFQYTRPDAFICPNGNYAPVTVYYAVNPQTKQGVMSADSNGECPGGVVQQTMFSFHQGA